MVWPPTLTLVLLTLVACNSEPDAPTTTLASSTGTSGTTTGTTAGSSTGEPTTGQTTASDGCASHPPGDWAACRNGGLTDNTLCGWTAGAGAGQITCLSPSIGGFNVCGIRDCVDDCDCFAGPVTGTAIPSCEMVGGSTACVLYCLNGQKCPDGMECISAYCYWPD